MNIRKMFVGNLFPRNPFRSTNALFTLFVCTLLLSCSDVDPEIGPPGEAKSLKTSTLETSSSVMQTDAPLEAMNIYLVGFHRLKDDPPQQVEVHHFCRQVNEDFMQCALFDSNTGEANLTGIEYIISKRLYEDLPEGERQYWHPRNYEILSGQLVAPGMPPVAETELMADQLNTYGKTWLHWVTEGDQQKHIPMGEARLGWSFSKDGELRKELLDQRDDTMGFDTQTRKEKRKDLREKATLEE